MTHAQRTRRAFHAWLQVCAANQPQGRRLRTARPRKPRNRHQRLQQQLEARRRVSTALSPAEGFISHAADGRAYTRAPDGSIRRVPDQDRAPRWKQRARTIRDYVASLRSKGAPV
jgi:hypothetical protein